MLPTTPPHQQAQAFHVQQEFKFEEATVPWVVLIRHARRRGPWLKRGFILVFRGSQGEEVTRVKLLGSVCINQRRGAMCAIIYTTSFAYNLIPGRYHQQGVPRAADEVARITGCRARTCGAQACDAGCTSKNSPDCRRVCPTAVEYVAASRVIFVADPEVVVFRIFFNRHSRPLSKGKGRKVSLFSLQQQLVVRVTSTPVTGRSWRSQLAPRLFSSIVVGIVFIALRHPNALVLARGT